MSLLAFSVLAVVVGVLVVAFLVMRFALKMMWKIAVFAVMITVVVLGGGAAYWYLVGAPVELPSLPALPGR